MKKLSGLILLAALLFVLPPGTVHATTYEGIRAEDGSVSVVNNDTGEEIAVLSLRLGTVSQDIAVDGDWIYFTGSVTNYTDYSTANSFYAYNRKTKEQVFLKSLPTEFGNYDVNDVYDGWVYLTGWTGSDDSKLYRWNISGKKLETAAEDGYAYRYKKYIVCESTAVHGAFTTYPIFIYNTKTGKTVTAVTDAASYGINKGYLYIARMPKFKYPEKKKASYKIIRYKIASGKKKTLKKKVKAYMIGKVNTKYIYHRKSGSAANDYKDTFYRTVYKSGKTKQISMEKYYKALKIPLPQMD